MVGLARVGQGNRVEHKLNDQQDGLRLHFETGDACLYASFAEGAPIDAADEAWLQQRLVDEGHGALRPLPMAVGALLQGIRAGQAVSSLKIAERIDAVLRVEIASDELSATLTIMPAFGGHTISKDEVLAALLGQGITEGIDLEAINGAIAQGFANHVLIARGRPPEHGVDGSLECMLPETRDRRPRVSESGQVDYRDLGDIFVVRPGDLLMLRHPPTEGTPGISVRGRTLPARPGKNAMFASKLEGASVAPDDPDRLVAAVIGQPVQVRDGVMVEPVFSVAAVTMATGNIRFDGSVKIAGDVAAGMAVTASGDIEIGGVAESATLEAGGSIVIKGGALGKFGRKEAESPRIHCGGSFYAAYAQQVRVIADDSIFIDDIAMQCELTAGNHIRVGNRKRGQVIGGHLHATLSIHAKLLGSANRIETRLEIGSPPTLLKQKNELAKKRDGEETQLLEISKVLAFAEQHPGKLGDEMLERARRSAAMLSTHIAELRESEEAIGHTLALAHDAKVVAEQRIHEGVVVTLGNQRYRVVGEHGPGAIGLGALGLQMLDGPGGD